MTSFGHPEQPNGTLPCLSVIPTKARSAAWRNPVHIIEVFNIFFVYNIGIYM